VSIAKRRQFTDRPTANTISSSLFHVAFYGLSFVVRISVDIDYLWNYGSFRHFLGLLGRGGVLSALCKESRAQENVDHTSNGNQIHGNSIREVRGRHLRPAGHTWPSQPFYMICELINARSIYWSVRTNSSKKWNERNKKEVLFVGNSIIARRYRNVLGVLFTMELYCTPKVNTLQLNTVGNSSNTRRRPTRTASEHSLL
jgi:hypothetical protein